MGSAQNALLEVFPKSFQTLPKRDWPEHWLTMWLPRQLGYLLRSQQRLPTTDLMMHLSKISRTDTCF